ncbi:MAG: S-methyl-5-thioribose-1-phosphate isomerase, partial [Planctomycetota bacterium]|nr:S-methyl-5-thioribose-1-phosphate isomerase [Planctomycetota bacterium]MDI6787445.1 S-methyl-5-thioribose-1-phosphate isomerase [Planctomycetota bacterium]
MQIKAIEWVGDENGYLKLIDQQKLPHKLRYLKCYTFQEVADAIKTMKVRGAPAIGIAAAFGAYLGIRNFINERMKERKNERTNSSSVLQFFRSSVYQVLLATRPTAVNLKWALDRIAMALKNGETEELKNKKVSSSVLSFFSSLVYNEALKILKEDRETCDKIGKYGAKLVKNHYRVLTYCNAGLLATGGSGTALSVLYQAKREGKKFSVFACETRPLLQGARLTVWELQRNKISVTLICDNMVGRLMQEGGEGRRER